MILRALTGLLRTAAGHPRRAVAAVAVLVAVAALFALRLEPTATTETLVGKSSESYQATDRFREQFGDDAIAVLVEQPLRFTVLTADLGKLIGLEGCLSGNKPDGVDAAGGPDGPCARLAETKPVRIVVGPGTFLNTAVNQITEQFGAQQQATAQQAEQASAAAQAQARERGASAAEARQAGAQAAEAVNQQFTSSLLQLAVRYGLGLNALPSLDNPDFVSRIVFDEKRAAGCPKQRFAYLFPTCESALITIRLEPGLTEGERQDAIATIRAATRMPEWTLENGRGDFTVTGAPVVVADLTVAITDAIVPLLVLALLVMALTLSIVFGERLRLLPLVVALAATALTFGTLSIAGAGLTMASIAVLPVLIGLAVDYAIQLHARVEEERMGEGPEDVGRAVGVVARQGAPTIVTAAAATAGGFLVLVLSPVPMVRGFGILLVLGIALAVLATLVLTPAVLVAAARRDARRAQSPVAPAGRLARLLAAPLAAMMAAGRGARDLLGPALGGARDILAANPVTPRVRRLGGRVGRGTLAAATARPSRVVAIAFGVAAVGWGLDTQAEVESDIQKLVPRDLPALVDLERLQEETGIGGEIDVVVTSDELTAPSTLAWMSDYQERLLKRFDYTPQAGCGEIDLCPAFSLPDLFRTGAGARSQEQIDALLDAVPAYFSQGVVTPDKTTATLAFGIKLLPLERQQEVIDIMREELDPPEGVRAELAGLPVLAAEANASVSSPWRRALTLLAGLLVVAIVLRFALGDTRRALVPLVPIALATGWSSLVLFLTRIPLNPMSVTLGALVIAISTEFSVLLSERYRQERAAGHDPHTALRRTYASTGVAVRASGITAIAGFAVLVTSDIRMLRDFGAVTVVDLSVSLLGVLVVLPSVLVLAERRAARGAPGCTWAARIPRPALPRLRVRRRPATATGSGE